MSGRTEQLHVVEQWLGKAEEDLKAAEFLLKMEDGHPFPTICFHTQQAVEKNLKAVLAFHSIPFPKTHDLAELVAILPMTLKLPLTLSEIGLLKRYSVETRYPGDWDPISRSESESALRMARQVRDTIRTFLKL